MNLLTRRQGFTVCEGLCPHCKSELQKFMARYLCKECAIWFTIRDPRDDIDELLKSHPEDMKCPA